jgi:TolB protein
MKLLPLLIIILFFSNFSNYTIKNKAIIINDTLHYPGETHFKNIRQLTFGGDNAEAYWSYDGKSIVFQRTSVKDGVPCDQIFIGKVPEKREPFTYKMISSGKGRTTCAFFTEDNQHVIYASTHKGGDACPPVPDRNKYGNRYIWPVYDSYDIFITDIEGKQIKQLTTTPGYDAEATVSPDGTQMIFTSIRGGDLDLYVMDLKTGKTTQVTDMLGYDGGAWFSRDGKKIVWRASRPKTEEEIKEYKELLAEGLVAPTKMEVWTADTDGKNAKQITALGGANWAPNFMPDGNIIFCSNHEYRRGFPFNMYTMTADGKDIKKVTRDKGFDAFPMFSPDGKRILFSSNRNNGGTNETNVFLADWVE